MKSSLSKTEFERIYENGKRSHGTYCRVLALPGSGKWGVATSKKIGCHARRNRLKRRIREGVRRAIGDQKVQLDFVVSSKMEAETAPFQELCADIAASIDKSIQQWENASASSS